MPGLPSARLPSALTLAFDYPPGHTTGMGTHIRELCAGLARLGHPSTVLARQRQELPAGSEAAPCEPNLDVYRVARPSLQPPASTAPGGSPAPDLAAELMQINAAFVAFAERLYARSPAPDLLHCHDFFLVPAAVALRQRLGRPLVVTVHMLHDPLFRWWGQPLHDGIAELERTMCRSADALISVSRSMGELIELTHGLAAGSVHVVYNGFDPDELTRAADAARPGWAEGFEPKGPVVVYAGRVARQKGITELLSSAHLVIERHPNVTYLVAGPLAADEEFARAMQQRVREDERLCSRVRFLGKLPRHELATLYQLATIAVVPSLYEPFGYAATEAMALGVPVVVSSSGGLGEIVRARESGLVVPAHTQADGTLALDVDALAAAQLELLGDPLLARRLGAAGAVRVRESFTLERMLQQTSHIYQMLNRRAAVETAPRAARHPG